MEKQLVWYGKQRMHSRGKGDVSMTVSPTKSKGVSANLTFRNEVDQIIFADSPYARFAILGTRLYFGSADEKFGCKLCGHPDSVNKYVHVSNKRIVEFVSNHIGDYMIKYDKELDCYYIETQNENDKKGGK